MVSNTENELAYALNEPHVTPVLITFLQEQTARRESLTDQNRDLDHRLDEQTKVNQEQERQFR